MFKSFKKYPVSWAITIGVVLFVFLTVFVSYSPVINAIGFVGFVGIVLLLNKYLKGNDR